VHKIAGHLAEAGSDLRTVKEAAQDVAGAIRSLGVSLSACTIPGQKMAGRLGEGEAELGLGIHGEPGAAVIEARSVKHIVDLMADQLSAGLGSGGSRLGLLVNNLGSVTPMEMGVIVNEVLHSRLGQQIELVFGPAPLMTSLDMNGFSLSLIELNDARRQALLSPVEATAWLPGRRLEPKTFLPLPKAMAASVFQGSASKKTAAVVRGICDVLIQKEPELNALDAKVGDGDTGTTFATAARSVMDRLTAAALPLAHPDQLCLAIGELLGKTTGGSSGVLLSIFFTAAGTEMKRSRSLRGAFGKGIAALQHYGGAHLGDRTMLDALVPAIDALEQGSLHAAAAAAQRGADATASMTKAHAGRSSYVTAANLKGVTDPGATAVALAFLAAAAAQLDVGETT